MSKVPQFSYLKTKIVLSFSIVVAVLVSAGYITYKNFEILDNALIELSRPNSKLRLFTQLLGEITSSENEIRKLVLNKNKNLIKRYETSIKPLNNTLDTLRTLVENDTLQGQQLDEVTKLLKAKKGSFNAYIRQKKRAEQFDTYEAVMDKAAENIGEEIKSALKESNNSIKPNIPDKDLSIPILFREYKNAIENYYKEYTRFQFSPENVVEMDELESILSNVQFSQSSNLASMTDRELELLQNNTEITERIRSIIGNLEKDELVNIENKQSQTRAIIQEANNTLYAITFFAFFIISVFIYLIFSDITKSNFYRKQLVNAKLKAEQLSKVKQEFLANMSHEIRTPLNAIIGFSEQLGKTPINDRQSSFLHAVKHSSEHLLSTVNDILDFSKIDAGKLKIETIPFRLDETIINVCNTLQVKAEEKGIQLDINLDKDFDQVILGDPFRLQQILINLVNNAIKFTDEGFVEVEGEILDKMGKNIKVCIRVNDTGIGIAKNKLQTIFKNFSQADYGTTRKYGGTGLGLSIVQKLVSLMKGKIAVESEPGKGASFILELRFAKAENKDIAAHLDKSEMPKMQFSKGKVLVVDDDHFNLMLCKTILNQTQLKVKYAASGKEAMKFLKTEPFDLLITDIQMPGISGLELAEFTRNLKGGNKPIPIVAFTANVMKEDLTIFTKKGITDYLLKPFREKDFLIKISEHLPESYSFKEQSLSTEKEVVINDKNEFYSFEKLKKFTGNDQESLHQIIDSFIISSKKDMKELVEANEINDLKIISEKAHKLLNGFQNFDVKTAIPILKALEVKSKILPKETINSMVNDLLEIHKKLLNDLNEKIDLYSKNPL